MWIVVLGCFSGAVCRRWCHKTRRQRAVGSLKRRKYKKKAPPVAAGDSKEPERNSDEQDNVPTDFCDPESQYDQESCVICLSEFDDGDSITTLPCGHDYHTECIKPWLLKRSSKCPICKASFLPKKKKDSAASSPHSNVETPLLSDPHGVPAQSASEEGASDDSLGGDSDEDDHDFEDEEEEDDSGHFWPASVFGLSPGVGTHSSLYYWSWNCSSNCNIFTALQSALNIILSKMNRDIKNALHIDKKTLSSLIGIVLALPLRHL